jgi:hypothetical protein
VLCFHTGRPLYFYTNLACELIYAPNKVLPLLWAQGLVGGKASFNDVLDLAYELFKATPRYSPALLLKVYVM